MKCDIFLMILNSKKHEGQVPKMELALLFQISLLIYWFAPHALKGRVFKIRLKSDAFIP